MGAGTGGLPAMPADVGGVGPGGVAATAAGTLGAGREGTDGPAAGNLAKEAENPGAEAEEDGGGAPKLAWLELGK